MPESVTWLLLGALWLRALVPAGFMLAPADGHLSFVLCQASGTGGAVGMPHGEALDGPGSQHRHPASDADPNCPYAQSAGPALLPALPVVARSPARIAFTIPAVLAQAGLRFGPPRELLPRGPPLSA